MTSNSTSNTTPENDVPFWLQALGSDSLVPLITSFIIGVPSAILYAGEVAVMVVWWREKYSTAFYALFIVRAIIDLSNFFLSFGLSRFGRLGWFLALFLALPRPVLAFIYWSAFYLYHAGNLATAFMLVNRLTGIIWPTKQIDIWRVSLWWSVGIVFLVPLLVTGHIFWLKMFVHVQPDGRTFTLDYEERLTGEPVLINDVLASAIGSALFMCVSLALNIGILVAYRRSRQQNASGKTTAAMQSANEALERRLTGYTLATFVGQFLFAFYEALIYLVVYSLPALNLFSPAINETAFLAVFNQMPWVSDLTTVALPSLLLLWASKDMRKRLFGLLKLNLQQPKTTAITKPGNNQLGPNAGRTQNSATKRNAPPKKISVLPIRAWAI